MDNLGAQPYRLQCRFAVRIVGWLIVTDSAIYRTRYDLLTVIHDLATDNLLT